MLSIILLIIAIFIIYFLRKKKKTKDNFFLSSGFGGKILLQETAANPIVNTPLEKMKSRFFINPDMKVFRFFSYNPWQILGASEQGDLCGSCWAIVIASLISDRIIVKYNGSLKIKLSYQQLLQCYNYPNGCDGENPENVLKWMIDTNFVMTTDKQLPYEQIDSGTILKKCPPKYKEGFTLEKDSLYSIVKYIEPKLSFDKIDKKILNSNVLNMKKELILKGPFFATIAVYDDLINFTENAPYYKDSENYVGGHAIEIIGYCEPGVDIRRGYINGYWICKNSWGEGWPKNAIYPGIFTIRMGVNECGIESRCAAVEVLKQEKPSDITHVSFNDFDLFKRSFLRKYYR